MINVEKAVLHLINAYREVDQAVLSLDQEDPERDTLINVSCELMNIMERLRKRMK